MFASRLLPTIATPADRPSGPAIPGGAHLPVLDGLRGIAILAVILAHLVIPSAVLRPETATLDRLLYGASRAGWAGVDLFFVLSGFLITGILLDAKGRDGYFRVFYGRRIARIVPLYYVVLLLTLVGYGLLDHTPLEAKQYGALVAHQGWLWAYATNLFAVTHGSHTLPHYVGHYWSLAVEEQFYLLWPLVVYRARPRTVAWVAVGAIGAAFAFRLAFRLAGAGPDAGYHLLPARMDGLAMGALIAVAHRSRAGLAPWRRLAGWGLGLGALGFVVCVGIGRTPHWQTEAMQIAGYSSLVAVSGGTLVLALLAGADTRRRATGAPWHVRLLVRLLTWRPLARVGALSYGLYILHMPVADLVWRAGLHGDLLPAVGGTRMAGMVVVVALQFGLTWALATLAWRWIEQPALRLRPSWHPGSVLAGAAPTRP